MGFWNAFVELIFSTLVSLAVACGGNMGMAIGLLSMTVRLCLLPLTLRVAYRSLETQEALKKIQPELNRIRARYKADPRKMMDETGKLYQKHGIRSLDGAGVFTMVIQAPVFIGVYSAVRRGLAGAGRFLWVKDLARPDAVLAGICAALTGLSTFLAPNVSTAPRSMAVWLPMILTFVFLSRLAAGLAIYSIGSGLVGVLQTALVRRRASRIA
jgi:YidC/Oxa1 family membrane protein insertase